MKIHYKGLGNLCFFLAYDLFIALNVLQSSNVDFMVSSWIRYTVGLLIMFLLIVKIISGKKILLRTVVKWGGLITISLIPILHSYSTPLLVMMLILACENVPQEKIILRMQIGLLVWSFVVFLLCYLGVLTNYVYAHNLNGVYIQVYAYGFKYYSTIGYIAMAELMAYLMQRKKECYWLELACIVLADYLLYRIHTTTLAFYAVLLFVLAYIVTHKIKIFNFSKWKRFWTFIAIGIPWAAMGITLISVSLYRTSGMTQLLRVFNGNQLIARLRFSSQAIDMYGINLFGSQVEVYGQTAFIYGGAKSEFYIDSGYMYSLIVYGVVFTLMILSLYSLILKYIYLTQKDTLFLYMLIFTGICIINNFLLSASYNPLLLIGGSAILKNVKLKERVKRRVRFIRNTNQYLHSRRTEINAGVINR